MTMPISPEEIATALPQLRDGDYRFAEPLARRTWLKVGGAAQALFTPKNERQLAEFLKSVAREVPLFTLGGGTNLLVRDGGFAGVVIKLGRGFADVRVEGGEITAGGGCSSRKVAEAAAEHGLSGLEFLVGIPGTVGGAVAMNAGAWGREVSGSLKRIIAFGRNGERIVHRVARDNFSYRRNHLPRDWIFTAATWGGLARRDKAAVAAEQARLEAARKATQPLARTAGSTFVNPPGDKAWRLIASVGGRGMRVGGAMMSERHCNFMLNADGTATATDFENLAEEIRRLVEKKHGLRLRWEIRRVGEKA